MGLSKHLIRESKRSLRSTWTGLPSGLRKKSLTLLVSWVRRFSSWSMTMRSPSYSPGSVFFRRANWMVMALSGFLISWVSVRAAWPRLTKLSCLAMVSR